MEYYQDGVTMDTKMSAKGFTGGASAFLSGESPFRMVFNNPTENTLYVGLTPNAPLGTIIPIKLTEHTGNIMNAKLGAYMGSMGYVRVVFVRVWRESVSVRCASVRLSPPCLQRRH